MPKQTILANRDHTKHQTNITPDEGFSINKYFNRYDEFVYGVRKNQ